MRAAVVTETRDLEVRDVPTPTEAPAGHLLVEITASAINHGDIIFLSRPAMPSLKLASSKFDIWGSSAVGKVLSVGPDVPEEYSGRMVSLYRSLTASSDTVGLWCERAVIPYHSALILPEGLPYEEYSGSLVNVITSYAFLETIIAEGHRGIVVTAGCSATGVALATLAKQRDIPVISLVRSQKSKAKALDNGLGHVLVTSDDDFDASFEELSEKLGTTAVFDGVGGKLVSQISTKLPVNSTIWFYGFLAGSDPVSIPPTTFMSRNLTVKAFSNFKSSTVSDITKRERAFKFLESVIQDAAFRTNVGKPFSLEEIAEAIKYQGESGQKAILLPSKV